MWEYSVDGAPVFLFYPVPGLNIFLETIAEQAAEEYWDGHDGWEDSWPVTIELFQDGESRGVFEVGMESTPVFFAKKQE